MVPAAAWTDTADQLVLSVASFVLPGVVAMALFLLVVLTIMIWGDAR